MASSTPVRPKSVDLSTVSSWSHMYRTPSANHPKQDSNDSEGGTGIHQDPKRTSPEEQPSSLEHYHSLGRLSGNRELTPSQQPKDDSSKHGYRREYIPQQANSPHQMGTAGAYNRYSYAAPRHVDHYYLDPSGRLVEHSRTLSPVRRSVREENPVRSQSRMPNGSMHSGHHGSYPIDQRDADLRTSSYREVPTRRSVSAGRRHNSPTRTALNSSSQNSNSVAMPEVTARPAISSPDASRHRTIQSSDRRVRVNNPSPERQAIRNMISSTPTLAVSRGHSPSRISPHHLNRPEDRNHNVQIIDRDRNVRTRSQSPERRSSHWNRSPSRQDQLARTGHNIPRSSSPYKELAGKDRNPSPVRQTLLVDSRDKNWLENLENQRRLESDWGSTSRRPQDYQGIKEIDPPTYSAKNPSLRNGAKGQRHEGTSGRNDKVDQNHKIIRHVLVEMRKSPVEASRDLILWWYEQATSTDKKLPIPVDILSDTVSVTTDILQYRQSHEREAVLNVLGAICNMSRTGYSARMRLRESPDFLTCLFDVLETTVDYEDLQVMICTRIVQNLTYAIQELVEPGYIGHREAEMFDRQRHESWFMTDKQKKNKKKSKDKSQMTKYDSVQPERIPCGRLLSESTLKLYMKFLLDSNRTDTILASLGVIQNMSVGAWEIADNFRGQVRKERCLPVLIELCNHDVESVRESSCTALCNLCKDTRNKELVGRYGLSCIVRLIPNDAEKIGRPASVCSVFALILEVMDEDVVSFIQDDIQRIQGLARDEECPLNVRRYASELLKKLWSYKQHHSVFKKQGFTKTNMLIELPPPITHYAAAVIPGNEKMLDMPFMSLSDPVRYWDITAEKVDMTAESQRQAPIGPSSVHVTDHVHSQQHPYGYFQSRDYDPWSEELGPPPAYDEIMK